MKSQEQPSGKILTVVSIVCDRVRRAKTEPKRKRYSMTLYQLFRQLLKKTDATVEPLLDWAARFLPHHFHRPPSTMHRWLAERLDRFHEQRNTKLNVLAPRNSAKSTIAALAFPLRELLSGREPYIWLISDTKSQAYTHLENIKNELTGNPYLAEAYPDVCGKGTAWRSGAIRPRNGAIIEAFGTGQRLRGRKRNENRPTLIICDDLQNDQHMLSAPQREKSRNWFHGTLLKTGSDRTNVIHLATALHREAIALELIQTPGWSSRTFRAIEQFPKNMSLWKDWETIYTNVANTNHVADADAFYEANRDAMDEDATVLWEEQEPLYALMKMRVESGYASFDREKQNMPINPELCEFPESYFEEHIWYDHPLPLPRETTPAPPKEGNYAHSPPVEGCPIGRGGPNIIVSAMALDPSKGNDSRHGDYSAFVYVALSEEGTFYVDARLERLPVSEMVALGIELYRKYQPTIFGVEANQFQELICDEFDRQCIDVYRIKNTLNKTARIRRLDSYLAQRRLRFCRSSKACQLLVEQLRSFPLGSHDDGPDALEMAVRMLEMYGEP